jgi:(2Fe-2S) ferredoxin
MARLGRVQSIFFSAIKISVANHSKGGPMIERPQPYIRQLHVCINNRNGESKSCAFDGSEEIVEELRKVTKERNLKGKVRVVRSGCLDVCAFGPNMMIWPEGLWYMKVTKEDVPQIIEKYLTLEAADQAK